jgi:hypothetical protein
MNNLLIKLITSISFFLAISMSPAYAQSHLDTAVKNLQEAIYEAKLCGGSPGTNCKGARAEAIQLMEQAMLKLQSAKSGK